MRVVRPFSQSWNSAHLQLASTLRKRLEMAVFNPQSYVARPPEHELGELRLREVPDEWRGQIGVDSRGLPQVAARKVQEEPSPLFAGATDGEHSLRIEVAADLQCAAQRGSAGQVSAARRVLLPVNPGTLPPTSANTSVGIALNTSSLFAFLRGVAATRAFLGFFAGGTAARAATTTSAPRGLPPSIGDIHLLLRVVLEHLRRTTSPED